MIDIKRAVKDGKRVQLTHVHDGNIWYKTEFDESFPVPISDMGDATFHQDEKAVLLMRYMRMWNKVLESDASDA